MFSIESVKEKARNIKVDLTFMRYINRTLEDEEEGLVLFTVSVFIGLMGCFLGWGLSSIFANFFYISTQQSLIHIFGMGILAVYSFIKLAYKSDYKLEQLKAYTLSQEEMKDYLRSLPEQKFKEKALKLIAAEVQEKGGKINFFAFHTIYDVVNKEIENQKKIDKEESKKEKNKEIAECLIKTLEKEVYPEKKHII